MSSNELWITLLQHETKRAYFFKRAVVSIPFAVFQQFVHEFFSHYSLLNNLPNYRSHHPWRHIHAIVYGDHVEIHIDHGNPVVSKWFYLPHFIFDVAPYFTYCLLWQKRPYYLD